MGQKVSSQVVFSGKSAAALGTFVLLFRGISGPFQRWLSRHGLRKHKRVDVRREDCEDSSPGEMKDGWTERKVLPAHQQPEKV